MTATRCDTLRELFTYSDWANTALLTAAAALGDEQLDRPFEMGLGTLRRTLIHIYNGEHVWLQRWNGRRETPWPDEAEKVGATALRARFEATWRARNDSLAELREDELERDVVYRDSRGSLYTAQRGQMLLQAIVHSQLHRAQAANMLRHNGATLPKPGLDYIFFRLAQPQPAPRIERATIRAYFEYGDWATRRVLECAAGLSDEQLDRPFEMGVGSLRATLLHIRFAEQWWYENWVHGPGRPFPELPPKTPVAEARRLFDETAAARNAHLAGRSATDLLAIVAAQPRPEVRREFPLGVTALQLCHHGTHHRAQAVNMLRRVGGEAIDLDYMYHVRSESRMADGE